MDAKKSNGVQKLESTRSSALRGLSYFLAQEFTPPMVYGPIGPAIKNFLIRRGYTVGRRTEIERSYAKSYWQEWLIRDLSLFSAVYTQNRNTLKAIPNWVTDDVLNHSLWRYGVPVELTSPIIGSSNRIPLTEIEYEITSPDLLAFIARLCLPKLTYLEVGVSVGKTLLQMHHQLSEATFVGIDIEQINHVIVEHFDTIEESWRAEFGLCGRNTIQRTCQ